MITELTQASEFYPRGLLDLGTEAPETLYVRGNAEALKGFSQSVAVVGARASTGYGEHIAMEITTGLVNHGFTVVNGGSYGIDGMALRASLAAEVTPLVWLAGGVDRLYPSGHETLLTRVLDIGGAIISVDPTNSAPTKFRFMERSKFLGYATNSTLVVEAGWRSGSLAVAEFAHEAGNFVGAVPGPITSASSAGCHRLLKDGVATVVTQASDVEYRLR